MKKKIVIGSAILLICLLVGGSFLFLKEKDTISSDEKKFKKEYEAVNGVVNEKNNKEALSLNIPEDNNIEYITADDVIKKLQEGTSVIYFGFPECPWCRNLVPVLLDAAKDYNRTVYYFNALSIRDTKHLDDDGNIVTDKDGTKEYQKIVDLLKDYLGEYEGLNDSSIKRLYFPTVAFVKDGKIVDVHIGVVESQKDPYKGLTKKQRSELEDILDKHFSSLVETCEKDSKC